MSHDSSKRAPDCRACGAAGVRVENFDAYACLSCVVWLEERCGDATCSFCFARPARPYVQELK